jgi:prepilin-type processing-associated H-X9-DG protein
MFLERVITKMNDNATINKDIKFGVVSTFTGPNGSNFSEMKSGFNVTACNNAVDWSKKLYTGTVETTNNRHGRHWWCGMNSYHGINTIMPPNGASCAGAANDGTATASAPTSYHSGGVNASKADGSVQFVSDTVNAISPNVTPTTAEIKLAGDGNSDFGVWGAMGTKDGGEATSL